MTITSDGRTADLPTGVKDKVRDAKETAQAKIEDIKQHLHAGTDAVQDKAAETTQQAKHLADQAAAKLPEPVVGRLTQVMAAVRQRPIPAVVALLAVLLVLRRLLSRNS
jgi:phosphosulfolactate synthase (CoM biosynthesis protein A)